MVATVLVAPQLTQLEQFCLTFIEKIPQTFGILNLAQLKEIITKHLERSILLLNNLAN